MQISMGIVREARIRGRHAHRPRKGSGDPRHRGEQR
jgi:hypothetical protein